MKKFYFICLVFTALAVQAQEMVVPSSFDENKMIVKRMDNNGNFLPVDENTLPAQEGTEALPAPELAPAPVEQAPKKTKRFRAVEKNYELPTTTFGSGGTAMQLPSTFSTQTMAEEMRDVRREHTFFQECSAEDKDCGEYEVDENGQVIFK